MALSLISENTIENIKNPESLINNKARALVKKKQTPGISGYVFSIDETEKVNLESDITDHWVESGTYINDHRVIKPIKITLTGLIGELVYEGNNSILDFIDQVDTNLSDITSLSESFLPAEAQNILKVNNSKYAIAKVNKNIQKSKNIANLIKNSEQKTKQQQDYEKLEAYFSSDEFFTVLTNWKFFDNMVIESIVFSQDENSKYTTNVTVILKQVRSSSTTIKKYDDNLFPVRTEIQSSEEQDQGQSTSNSSLLFEVFN